MRNNAYWPQRQQIQVASHNSPQTYRVMRVSQSPNRQYFSPSPGRPVIQKVHQLPNNKAVIGVPQSVYKTQPVAYQKPPSQIYYTTNPSVLTNANGKPKKNQEPYEEYNVWQGYESKKDLMQNTCCILTQRSKTPVTDQKSAPKDFKKRQIAQTYYTQSVPSTQSQGARSQIRYIQAHSPSPAKITNTYYYKENIR